MGRVAVTGVKMSSLSAIVEPLNRTSVTSGTQRQDSAVTSTWRALFLLFHWPRHHQWPQVPPGVARRARWSIYLKRFMGFRRLGVRGALWQYRWIWTVLTLALAALIIVVATLVALSNITGIAPPSSRRS